MITLFNTVIVKTQIIKRRYGWFLIAALVMASCQQEESIDELISGGSSNADGVTLSFSVAGELSPRTNLPGSDNMQHVTSVRLYIFNGTNDNAPCIASEDIGWSAYFGNNPPTVTATMKYHVKYEGFVKGNPYTFLAVGLDDKSGSTYGFPNAIQVRSTVLSGAIATLAGTEASTWTSMRQSELFAGSTVLTPGTTPIQGNVDLWRRVAGVMGWFTNIPTQIGGTRVTAIRITLYTQQNKSVPLLQRSQTPVFADYINSPLTITGGNVLVNIAVPTGVLPVTVLSQGSYVLPVPAPTPGGANYTLKVELTDASGNALRSIRVTLSDSDDSNSSGGGGTGIIDPDGASHFPIVANRFYGVGSKLLPINLGGTVLRSTISADNKSAWEDLREK